jgi:hypothetical protein
VDMRDLAQGDGSCAQSGRRIEGALA